MTIEVYSKNGCIYCTKAKDLLNERKLSFVEMNVEEDPSLRDVMLERTGGRKSMPQIFMDGEHIGGFDDLYAYYRNLDKASKL